MRLPRYKTCKRGLDVVIAMLLCFLLLPVIIILTVATFIDQGKVFFRQERIGKDGKPFYILKFHTVIHLAGEPQITRYADFIRSHGLDEVPQLINVLKGDMSMVGPRPFFPEYMPYYSPLEELRHTVKPGITGLAQITGGNDLTWDEKLQLDLKYIRDYSLKMDISIILKTFVHIFKKSPHWEVVPLSVERRGVGK